MMGEVRLTDYELVLDSLVKAFYPIIYIVTNEEARLLNFMGRLTGQTGQYLVVWTDSKGFREYGSEVLYPEMNKRLGKITNPHQALNALEEIVANDPKDSAIFVMCDLHRYMDNPQIIRALKDISLDFRSNYKTLVIAGSQLNVPEELERDIAVIHYDLPDRAYVRNSILNTIVNVVGKEKFKEIKSSNPEFKDYVEKLTMSAMGFTSDEVDKALDKAMVKSKSVSRISTWDISEEKAKFFADYQSAEFMTPKRRMDDVGGMDFLKMWAEKKRVLLSFESQSYGVEFPRGLYFFGLSGTGKSAMAEAVSDLFGFPMLRVDAGHPSFKKESHSLAKLVRSVSPITVLIREKGNAQVIADFLDVLKNSDSGSNCYWPFVIVESNNDDLTLCGNKWFDEVFVFDLPTALERECIVASVIRQKGRSISSFNCKGLADQSAFFTGEEIGLAFSYAVSQAYSEIKDGARKESDDVNMTDVLNAMKVIRVQNWGDSERLFVSQWCDGNQFLMASANREDLCGQYMDRIQTNLPEEQPGDLNVNGRLLEGVPLAKPKVTTEQKTVVDSEMKIVTAESRILNPHITRDTHNLEIDGELQVAQVNTYQSVDELRNDFSREQLARLKNQFFKR